MFKEKERITIAVGPLGEWGSAFTMVLARMNHTVRAFSNHPEDLETFQKTRQISRLPGVAIPSNVRLFADAGKWIDGAELVVISTSSKGLRPFVQKIRSAIPPKSDILLLPKGLEDITHKRMSEILQEEVPNCRDRLAVLAGPNQAHDVARGELTGAVVAAYNPAVAKRIQKWVNSDRFWILTSDDVPGVEYAAAFKNIAAIVAGIGHRLNWASSTRAFLQTRILEETITISTSVGKPLDPLVALPLTSIGLAGLGDQLLSYGDNATRNHRGGMRVAEGWSFEDIEKEELREGLYALKAGYELGQEYKVHIPIINNLHDWVYNGRPKDVYQLIGLQPPQEKFSNGDFTYKARAFLSRLIHNNPFKHFRC